MGSAVVQGGRSADIHEFCFQAANRSDMDCVVVQGCLFANCREWQFQLWNVQIIAVHPARRSIC